MLVFGNQYRGLFLAAQYRDVATEGKHHQIVRVHVRGETGIVSKAVEFGMEETVAGGWHVLIVYNPPSFLVQPLGVLPVSQMEQGGIRVEWRRPLFRHTIKASLVGDPRRSRNFFSVSGNDRGREEFGKEWTLLVAIELETLCREEDNS